MERVRRADTDAERAQLRHEATMLVLARHPAVAAIVSAHELGDELVTRLPASSRLDGSRPPIDGGSVGSLPAGGPAPGSPGWLAALAAAAQTVADLHALGLVHHDLRPGVIWVDPQGRTVLDGFGQAGLAGQQARGDGGALRPSDDVAALAALAEVATTQADGSPPVWHRSRPSNRHAQRAHGRGDLPSLAEVVAAGRSGAWPPARRLAQVLEAATDDADAARSPSRIAPATAAGAARRARPPMVAAGMAVVGLGALAWGAMTVAARPARPSFEQSPAPQIVIGATRYQAGQPGDQVRIGRWSCQPNRVLLLRPGTGQIYEFTGWATIGHDEVAHQVDQVPPASKLVVTRSAQGCDIAAVSTPAGITIDVRLGGDR